MARPWHRECGPPGDLTPTETFQLEAFCDGSIMSLDVRKRLWRSWGLCRRHSWGFVLVEVETRTGRPFGSAILYDDLLGRAVAAVGSHTTWSGVCGRLRSRASCVTCSYLSSCSDDFVPPHGAGHAAYINRFRAFAILLERSWDEALSRACPLCAGGSGPICRPHIVGGADVSRRLLRHELGALHQRMQGLHRSMPWGGPPATPAMQASWIEALGWLGGWTWPFREGAR